MVSSIVGRTDETDRFSIPWALMCLRLRGLQPVAMTDVFKVKTSNGRAVTQAVNRRLPTAAARVRSRVKSCGICC
jgi:hypothetical protein